MLQTVSITIKGKVQGVFFRDSTKKKANEFGIVGTVKNMPDGSVHIIATGKPDNLLQLQNWCYIGSEQAIVQDILIERISLCSFDAFQIIR